MLWLVPRFNPSWAVLVKRLFFFLRADYLRTAWHLGIFHWRKPTLPVPRKERRNIRQNGPCSPASLNLGDFFHPWGHLWEIKLRGLLGKIFWLFVLQHGNSPHLNIKWWHEKGVGHPGQEKVVCALFFSFMIEAVRVLQSEKVYSNCDSASCCCTDWVNRIISRSSLSSVCVCVHVCVMCVVCTGPSAGELGFGRWALGGWERRRPVSLQVILHEGLVKLAGCSSGWWVPRWKQVRSQDGI